MADEQTPNSGQASDDDEPRQDSAMESIREAAGKDVDPGIDLDEHETLDGPAPTEASRELTGSKAGRYETRGEIGRGGMGAILEVRDNDLRRTLAMKVLLGQIGYGSEGSDPVAPEQLHRFLEEAQITAQLAHPGVVPVHELGMDADGRVFFTMGRVKGKTLREVIALSREGHEEWTRAKVLTVLLRVCETMAFAHSKGVVHRDLKPANVMVGKFGQVYVMDWGLAKVRGHEDAHDIRLRVDASSLSEVQTDRTDTAEGHESPLMTMDGAVVGTPAYMPLEQAEGRIDEVDEQSDVYSVGAMLYELLAGRPPYVSPGERVSPRMVLARVCNTPLKPVTDFDTDIPPELVAICEKAMAQEKRGRYADASDLADDVERFQSGHVVRAHRTGALIEFHKWVGRNRAVAATVAAALAVIAVGTVLFTRSLSAARERESNRADEADFERGRARGAQQQAEAERDAKDDALRRARTLGLVAASRQAAAEDTSVSLHLARAAVQLSQNAETVRALREAMSRPREVLRVGVDIHAGTVTAGAASGDGRYVAVGWKDGYVGRLDRSTGAWIGRVQEGRDWEIKTLAFSPDASHLLSVTATRAVIWDQGLNSRIDLRGQGLIENASFSPDGGTVVYVTSNADVRLVGIDGRQLSSFTLDEDEDSKSHQLSARFTRDGRHLLTHRYVVPRLRESLQETLARAERGEAQRQVPQQHVLELWTLAGQRVVRIATTPATRGELWFRSSDQRLVGVVDQSLVTWDLEGNIVSKSDVTHLADRRLDAISPDGSLTAWVSSAAGIGTAWLVDESGSPTAELRAPAAQTGAQLVFSPNGRWVVASYPGTLRVFNTFGHRITEAPVAGRGGAFVDGGRHFLIVSPDSVRIIDLFGGEGPTLVGGHWGVGAATFSPDGSRIVTSDSVTERTTARIWTIEGRMQAVCRHTDGFGAASWSPTGSHFVTPSIDGTAHVWDARGRKVSVLSHEGAVRSTAFSPDGNWLLTASEDGVAQLWALDGTPGPRLEHDEGVWAAEFSRDGHRVLTRDEHSARVWDLRGTELAVLRPTRKAWVTAAHFSPDGTRIVTCSWDGEVQIWTANGAHEESFRVEDSLLSTALFSPDSRLVLTADMNGNARIWTTGGSEVATLRSPAENPPVVAFSPTGKFVATNAREGRVKLWTATGELRAVLRGHADWIFHLEFSPDGRWLASASRDSTVRLWLVDDADLVAQAARLDLPPLASEERTRYAGLLGTDDASRQGVEPR